MYFTDLHPPGAFLGGGGGRKEIGGGGEISSSEGDEVLAVTTTFSISSFSAPSLGSVPPPPPPPPFLFKALFCISQSLFLASIDTFFLIFLFLVFSDPQCFWLFWIDFV
jgi:hypothetical protein